MTRRLALAVTLAVFLTASWAANPAGKPATRAASRPAGASGKTIQRTVFAWPFENVTNSEQYEPAAAGLADMVAVMLAEQPHIAVVERQRLLALTAEQALALKGLTGSKLALAAGKLLQADTVLIGRLFLLENKLTVSVQAIEIASERVLAADQLSCRPNDLPEAALQLARKLAQQMQLPLPDIDLAKIDKSPIASLHFAKALGHYYAGNMDAAIMQFMRTMDLDPDYVEAHYWSGMAYYRQNEYAHAVIEWDKYLQRQPATPYAAALRPLLADAKKRDAQTAPPRLGPQSRPASGPAPRP